MGRRSLALLLVAALVALAAAAGAAHEPARLANHAHLQAANVRVCGGAPRRAARPRAKTGAPQTSERATLTQRAASRSLPLPRPQSDPRAAFGAWVATHGRGYLANLQARGAPPRRFPPPTAPPARAPLAPRCRRRRPRAPPMPAAGLTVRRVPRPAGRGRPRRAPKSSFAVGRKVVCRCLSCRVLPSSPRRSLSTASACGWTT